jgi:hypothetical protein
LRPDLRIAVTHQLAVHDLEAGRLDAAEDMLKWCLRARELRRSRPDTPGHREAYEHRRLAQVYTNRAQFDRACEHFAEALRIATFHGFSRYMKAVEDDQKRLLPARYRARVRR